MKNLLLTIILLASVLNATAQFNLGAEIRPRAEFRNGFKSPSEKNVPPAFFIEQRSRLYFNYATEKLILKITFQDVRIWGSVDQIYKADPNMQNVYEAWGQFNFNANFGVRAGRMELDYDGARFLGNLDWAAQARSHDALLFLWRNNNGLKLDVGLAYNQNWRPEPSWLSQNFYDHSVTNNYKTMQFARFEKKSATGNLVALIHNDGRQVASDSSMAYRQTYALIADKKLGGVKLSSELYYQGGKNGNAQKVNAFLASLYATFTTRITPLTIGGEYLSGTSNAAAADNKDNAFAPLYGTNHKFYGLMDYFYVGNPHDNRGLVDLNIKTAFRVSDKAKLMAQLHHFLSPVEIPDPANTSQALTRSLGTEIDLVYLVQLHEAVKLHVGYSQMFATGSLEEIKGTVNASAMNNWAWLMVTFKPTLFETKKEDSP